jgi:hypothetical protein
VGKDFFGLGVVVRDDHENAFISSAVSANGLDVDFRRGDEGRHLGEKPHPVGEGKVELPCSLSDSHIQPLLIARKIFMIIRFNMKNEKKKGTRESLGHYGAD